MDSDRVRSVAEARERVRRHALEHLRERVPGELRYELEVAHGEPVLLRSSCKRLADGAWSGADDPDPTQRRRLDAAIDEWVAVVGRVIDAGFGSAELRAPLHRGRLGTHETTETITQK